jgi:DNA-binding NtrC family response regulator
MKRQLPTILVIDDEELIVEHAIATLKKLGLTALGRTTVDGAIEALKAYPTLRIVLSDIYLKSGTGPELVRRALRDRPELKVVFMSGGFDNVPFRQTDPLVDKPLDAQSLRQAIADVLDPARSTFERRKTQDRRRRIVLD